MNMQNSNPFAQLRAMGYTRLIPIVPPGAPLSERSSLSVRAQKGDDARGKVPGLLWPDGTWSGFDWIPCESEAHDDERWHAWRAGIGIKTGLPPIEGQPGVYGIDADALGETDAELIRAEATRRFGVLSTRIGQPPKALYVFRSPDAIPYQRVEFNDRIDPATNKRKTDRVEILGAGRQFVAAGIHPKTGQPYRWTQKLVAFDDLPTISAEQLADFMRWLSENLPQATVVKEDGHGEPVPQENLVGDLEMVRKAVKATPNTSAAFPEREDYLKVGIAIKAALPEHPAEAFEIYSDWCARWTDGTNESGVVEGDWRRFKPPFRIGAEWLYDKAQEHGDGSFTKALLWYEEPYEPLMPDRPEDKAAAESANLALIVAADLFGLPIPAQQWLLEHWIPANNVTLLSGDGATGKSLLALQLAVAVAIGGEWLGLKPAQGRAMFVSAEDEIEEVHRRLSAITNNLEALTDLLIVPLAGKDAVLAAPIGRDGLLGPTELFGHLEKQIARHRPSFLVLDTLADLFGGDEIKKVHARQFVALLRGWALRYGVTVLLLSHPSQSGMSSGSGTSGNVAWSNSVRSRLYLTRDDDCLDQRVLERMKANRAPLGEKVRLVYDKGRFVPVGGVSLMAPEDAAASDRGILFDLIDRYDAGGITLSAIVNAPNYAPRKLAKEPEGKILGVKRLADALALALKEGLVEQETFGPPSHLRRKLTVRRDKLLRSEPKIGLFD